MIAVYCSPAATLAPQSALAPHNALAPHRALLPQRVFAPHRALDPQIALAPQSALLPLTELELLVAVAAAGAPETNWDDPHTAAFDHVDDVFQTAVGLSLR